MIKLKVDATPLARRQIDGIGRYSQNLLRHLNRDNLEVELVGFMGDKIANVNDYGKGLKRLPLPRRLYSWLYKKDLVLPVGSKNDVVLCTNFIEFPKTRGKVTLVVHDLAYLTHGHTLTPRNRAYLQKYVPRSLSRAAEIIAISQATKLKLIKAYNIEPSKIAIVPPAIDPNSFKPAAESEKDAARKKYHLPEKYVLFFGTLEPRKNITGCIESYMLLPSLLRKKYGLVLAGGSGWQNQQIQSRIQKLRTSGENIYTPGYIDDADAPPIYSVASVFLFPSLDEGFGIPVIEAMACGTPVVASNIEVLKETAGNAALFADPLKFDQIARQVERILTDKKTAQQLVEKGFRRAEKFTWDESAKKMMGIISTL